MIYKCSRSVRFTHPENSAEKCELKPGYIGEVPAWVEKDWYFKACCKDGSITAIKSSSDRDIQAATDRGNEPPDTPPAADTPPASAGTDGEKGKKAGK